MPSTAATRHHVPRALPALLGSVVALVLLAAAPVRAQDTGPAVEGTPAGSDGAASAGTAKDPTVVIARTVQPRVAYRGVPLEENPIHSEATTFPGLVFHGTMDSVLGELVEGELGQHGSAGVMAGAAVESAVGRGLSGLTGGTLLGAGAGAGSAPSLGPGASAGGAVGGVGTAVGNATSNIGSLVTNTVMQAVGTTQGGGP